MDAKLKECPFCGSPAELEDHRTVWAVKCTSAACATIMLGDRAPEPDGEMGDAYWNGIKQTAIDRWNARAIAPPVAAGSVDTPEFAKLLHVVIDYQQHWAMYPERRQKNQAEFIAHINAWGAQQREQGKQEALDLTVSVGQLRERAEKAEAELESWVHTNRIDELQRELAELKRELWCERNPGECPREDM